MTRIKRIAGIALLGSFVLGGALSVALLVGALDVGSDGADEASTSSLPEQAGDATGDGSDSGFNEGITVHGDWVIEVRNPDGSVAERREFQNELSAGGGLLTCSLARVCSPGVWGVGLRSNVASDSPCMTPDPVSLCLIREPINSSLSNYPATHFTTLTVAMEQAPPETVLQGNFDAPNDGIINRVQTFNCFALPVNADPSLCGSIQLITETTLATPVNVVAGQQVLVTVRISFS